MTAAAISPLHAARAVHQAQDQDQLQDKIDRRHQERIEEAQRQEGRAILNLADVAMAGKSAPSDFALQWRNDFLKAQQGTFIPFTLTVDASKLAKPSALLYVRAAPRSATDHATRGEGERKGAPLYPVDAIFPIEFKADPGQAARVSRGFSLPAGEYDIYVVVRERADSVVGQRPPRAAVLKQPVSVPDYWSGDLTTSTVILADRLTLLSRPPTPEELIERPYVIGLNNVEPALDARFRRDQELIFVFLVYNPKITADRKYDLQVEYHFFRKLGPARGADGVGTTATDEHPPERGGEKYLNHTEPQRFNPAIMGPQFDPGAGHPVMAGQGVPLGTFPEGEYRLAIQVTDLLSGKTVARDVNFTVGS